MKNSQKTSKNLFTHSDSATANAYNQTWLRKTGAADFQHFQTEKFDIRYSLQIINQDSYQVREFLCY